MEGGAWEAIVHEVAKGQTQLSDCVRKVILIELSQRPLLFISSTKYLRNPLKIE